MNQSLDNTNNIELEVLEMTPHFIYGRLHHEITDDIMDEISDAVYDTNLSVSQIGCEDDSSECNDVRKGSHVWVNDTPFTNNVLQQLALDANEVLWNLADIDSEFPSIQYTLYDQPSDHYDWHQDHYAEEEDITGFHRKVSISLCLSHDDMYEGAEFFIKDGSNTNVRYFKMRYGDFIVFPSDLEHRVNALRSGSRLSLVVWYGTTLEEIAIEDQK